MKKTLSTAIVSVVMCLFLAVTALAVIENDKPARLYDGADLLTSSEEASLIKKLDGISEEFGVDVIVVTVEDTGSYSVDDFTENYYDTVFGQHNDGVMLLLSMEERDYRILSEGIGNDAVPYDDIESIGEDIVPYLSDGDYAEAFSLFADKCEYEINGEINGFPFETGTNLIISVVVGFVIALISTGIMVGQLKSVRAQKTANLYTKQGSMKVTLSNDLFLYRNVSKVKRETSSSGGRSSGGSSRSMGGGKF